MYPNSDVTHDTSKHGRIVNHTYRTTCVSPLVVTRAGVGVGRTSYTDELDKTQEFASKIHDSTNHSREGTYRTERVELLS